MATMFRDMLISQRSLPTLALTSWALTKEVSDIVKAKEGSLNVKRKHS